MSYFLQNTLVPINDSLTLDDGYLPIVINMFEPYSRVRRYKNGTCSIQGPFSDAIVNAARVAGLRIAVVNPSDIPYGIGTLEGEFETGTAFHYLKISTALAFASPAIAELDRWAAGDPMELLTEAYSLMTWIPPKEVDGSLIYKCIAPSVWYSLAIAVTVLALFCSAAERLDERPSAGASYHIFFNYLWEFFCRIFPQEPSGRQEVWFRCVLITYSAAISVHYMAVLSSALTSTLLVRDSMDAVDGFRDILRFPLVRLFTEADTALHTLFLEPKVELFAQLAPRVTPVTGIFVPNSKTFDLLNEVESRRAVIMCGDAQVTALVEMFSTSKGRCPQVKMAKGKAGLLTANIFFSRNIRRDLRTKLRKGIRWTMEAFLDEKATEWLRRGTVKCFNVPEEPYQPLSFEKTTGAFALLFAGYAVSILLCLAETPWSILMRSCLSGGLWANIR